MLLNVVLCIGQPPATTGDAQMSGVLLWRSILDEDVGI